MRSTVASEPQRKMHDWVSLLTTVRKTAPELEAGGVQVEDVAADSISYVRGFDLDRGCSSGSQRVLVIVNKAEHPKTIHLSTDKTALQNCTKADVLLGDEVPVELSSDKLQLLVQPESVVILRLE
jgi:hypothetical protein